MSFQQKNITVSLANFTLILIFYLIRVFQMIVRENFLQWNFKSKRNAKRQFQRGGVLSLFHGNDGLPRHTYFLRELLLGHLILKETQFPNVVVDPAFAHIRTLSDRDAAVKRRQRSAPALQRR